jgi:hypothetical protein
MDALLFRKAEANDVVVLGVAVIWWTMCVVRFRIS